MEELDTEWIWIILSLLIGAIATLWNKEKDMPEPEVPEDKEGAIDLSVIGSAVKIAAGLIPGEGGEALLAEGVVKILQFLEVREVTPDDVFDIDD